jgi:hypothetical protein
VIQWTFASGDGGDEAIANVQKMQDSERKKVKKTVLCASIRIAFDGERILNFCCSRCWSLIYGFPFRKQGIKSKQGQPKQVIVAVMIIA